MITNRSNRVVAQKAMAKKSDISRNGLKDRQGVQKVQTQGPVVQLSKYVKFDSMEVMRSAIRFSRYNPRVISEEAKKALKRGIKKYGLVGGIVVNSRTGNTIVSGHQRVMVLDELNHYDPAKSKEHDYRLKVDMIDVDEVQEKELNVLLNNPGVQGQFDMDLLREMIPDINVADVGLTAEDLAVIGVDESLLQTEDERNLADALSGVTEPEDRLKQAEKEAKAEMTKEEKVAHNKDVKQQIKEAVIEKAKNTDAYVMLVFKTVEAKAAFMQRFGQEPDARSIRGEEFSDMIERIE